MNLDLMLLNAGYSDLNATWNWDGISSPFARIYFVTGGHAQLIIEGTTFDLQPNYLYLIPPFTLHSTRSHHVFSHYYIHFYEKAQNRESIFDTYRFPIEVECSALSQMLVQRLLEINPERYLKNIDPQLYDNAPTMSHYMAENVHMPKHSLIETKGILYQLMAVFFAQSETKLNNKDKRTINALQYIHQQIDNVITLRELADIACVTEDHFIRIFKRDMNFTPLQYINIKKVEKSQLLLISTDLPVRDIAFGLSIDNISYFNRLFKLHTGKTPSEYREEHKES